MNRKKYCSYLWLIVLTCFVHRADAQYENIWICGHNAGVDFNGTTPVAITSNIGEPPVNGGGSSASVCDSNGGLLFYTEGYKVFDRQHNLMPDGNRLVPFGGTTTFTPTSQTSQGSLIVPMPGRRERYYIFSLTSYVQHFARNNGKLFYSVVDMNLNNGLGDVVFGRKGIPLDDGLGYYMTAVAGRDCNIWVLVISLTGELKAYEVTVRGVNPVPVISQVTMDPTLTGGCIDVSPDGSMIAFTQNQLLPDNRIHGLALLDFDPATGRASNERILITDGSCYGVCFSPDNTKLYVNQITSSSSQSIFPTGLYQFDVSSGNLTTILASQSQLISGMQQVLSHIKRGPDGKVYFNRSGSVGNSLSVIHYPNLPGITSQWAIGVIAPVPGTALTSGLPNVVPPFVPIDTIVSSETVRTCNETQITITARDTSGLDYIWNDGATGTGRTVDSSGTYWVGYYSAPACAWHTDTFHAVVSHPAYDSFSNAVCTGEPYEFNGRLLYDAGIYRDTFATVAGCDSVVAFELFLKPVPELSLLAEPGNRLCLDESFTLEVTGADHYQWLRNGRLEDGYGTKRIHLSQLSNPVMVVGMLATSDCLDTLTTVIYAESCCDLFVPDAFTPNGDGRNDGFGATPYGNIRSYRIQIFNRWGEMMFTASDVRQRWNGAYKGMPAEPGSYFYTIAAECTDGSDMKFKGDLTLIR